MLENHYLHPPARWLNGLGNSCGETYGLSWYGKFYDKKPVRTSLFQSINWSRPVLNGLVSVPQYLGSVWTGCSCQLPYFDIKNWTEPDLQILVGFTKSPQPKHGTAIKCVFWYLKKNTWIFSYIWWIRVIRPNMVIWTHNVLWCRLSIKFR